jgi:two-component system sensor histidine kinase KdpD
LQKQATQSLLQTEADRARSKLLQSVAHDLRVPLVAAMGATSTLMEMGDTLEGKQIKKLGKDMYFELEQLSRLITNLLQMTYLEAEDVQLQKESGSLLETINLVLKTSHKKIGKKPVILEFPPDLPNVPLDSTLIQEVFHNLIDNAIKYTPANSPIEISATLAIDRVIIKVQDRGPGIMPDEVNQLFEKFYRGRKLTTERGVGLGLAICRSIIKAHGGDIWAENREGGGAAFCFSLPLK